MFISERSYEYRAFECERVQWAGSGSRVPDTDAPRWDNVDGWCMIDAAWEAEGCKWMER